MTPTVLTESPEGRRARTASAAPGAPHRPTLLVVGNGMVGFRLCERLVAERLNEQYEVVVLGEEPRPAYDRVHLTDLLASGDVSDLTLESRDWYARNGIRLETGRQVETIDRSERVVRTQNGDVFPYDTLVLATGSRPYLPPIPGVDLENVFVYRTIEDLDAIRARARATGSAAVIGGGLLGLEAARALQLLGVECHVLEQAPYPLCTQLDPSSGDIALGQIRRLGIHVHTGVHVRAISRCARGLGVDFSNPDDSRLQVDLVVVAAGIRPRDELAKSTGLAVGGRGGIQVDDRLRTSDPNIYAVGECAAPGGVTYGLVAPGFRMAEVLARNLAGGRSRFEGGDLSTRLKVLGLDVAALGDYSQPGTILSWQSGESYRSLIVRDGRLVGATALGDWSDVRQIQDAVMGNVRIWPWQARRFRRYGRIGHQRPEGVRTWADTATVCNCMSLSRGTLAQAAAHQATSVDALVRATGAGSLCGSCRPLLAELLDVHDESAPATAGGLGTVGLAAIALVAMIAFMPAIPYPDTVQGPFAYDLLWRSTTWHQTTGFAVLALSATVVLLSLRKRWKRFQWGNFGIWRVLHGIGGLASLGFLIAHTGFRFGSNLNFFLMMTVLGASVAGGMAAATGGPGTRLPGRWGRELNRALTWSHIALVGPLPVLLGFHIVTVYYF